MNNFLKELFLFFMLLAISLFMLIGFFYYIFGEISYKIPNDKNILIIGDSHTECSIDDSIFSRSVNISQSGTPYYYSYIKLKKFMSENKSIDTVLLSIHPGVIGKSIDSVWVYNSNNITWKVSSVFNLIHKTDFEPFLFNIDFYLAFLKIPINNIQTLSQLLLSKQFNYKSTNIGAYNKNLNNNLKENLKKINNRKMDDGEIINPSLIQREYIERIIRFCNDRNTTIILISTPVYNPNRFYNPNIVINYLKDINLKIKLSDYSRLPLDDSCFADISHLNYKGAQMFSSYLNTNGIIITNEIQ